MSVETLRIAIAKHRAGELAEAERLYRQVLSTEPGRGDALHLLGLLLGSTGRSGEAEQCLTQAAKAAPAQALYQVAAGEALRGNGRVDEAVSLLEAARRRLPKDPQIATALGLSLFDQGNGFAALGRHADAEASYRRTLAYLPQSAEARFNLGNALAEQGRLEAAADSYRDALRQDPFLAPAHANLLRTLKRLGQPGEAACHGRRALALEPAFYPTMVNLGDLWTTLGRIDLARPPLARARAIEPEPSEALVGQGLADLFAGRIGLALGRIRASLALKPAFAAAFNDLAAASIEHGEVERSFARALAIEPGNAQVHSNLLFAQTYDPALDNRTRFAALGRWQARHAPRTATPSARFENARQPERALRVGYLSADLRSHPIAYNLEGLIEQHDRSAVEPIVYSVAAMPDAVSRRIESRVGHWRSLAGATDRDIARQIRADVVDILVIVAAHIGDNRPLVAAERPAPVQVSFHDVISSGLATVDAWLTDWVLHPAETSERFVERLVRLPCFYLHRPPEAAPEPAPPPALSTGQVTFGSCNNILKINDNVIALWGRILAAVPSSRLLLKYKNCFADASVQAAFLSRFARHGIARNRIQFLGGDLPRERQLAVLNEVDVALDPFPFNGSTTSFEALWMGVPLVTLAGDHFAARVGASLLAALDQRDWIAEDADAYVRIAVGLAEAALRSKTPRSELRRRILASPLCDAGAYARAIEHAYRALWREWCVGQ